MNRLIESSHGLKTFMSHFSLNPFADKCWAIRDVDALRFATCQKTHHISIHEFHLVQIQNQAMIIRFGLQQFLQLSQAGRLDSSAQSKDNKFSIRRSLNLKHRFVQHPLEQCKRNTNRKRLKKLDSVSDKMPTFRKLPKVQQGFSEPKQLDGFDVKAVFFCERCPLIRQI